MRAAIRATFSDFSEAAHPVKKLMLRVQNESSSALKDSALRAQHHTMQLGSVVLMSGFFESFLRALCENYFAELLTKGFGMQKLGTDYLEIHLREGAGHLADLVKRESKKKPLSLSDSSAFVRRLVAPITDASKAPVWEAFSRTQGNPSPDVVKNILSGLGIKGGLASIEGATGGRYSASSIEQLLRNFVELRNECAHTGSAKNVPQPSTVLDQVYFLRVIALGMCKLTDQKITALSTP